VSLKARCFCGAVEIEIAGSPEAMGYCHCRSCRSWSGGPVNAYSPWKPEAVRIIDGAEHVAMFQKSKMSQRQYCAKCGGHLMINHPPPGLVRVFAPPSPISHSPRPCTSTTPRRRCRCRTDCPNSAIFQTSWVGQARRCKSDPLASYFYRIRSPSSERVISKPAQLFLCPPRQRAWTGQGAHGSG
jgi:hypothetical protein